MRRIRLARLQLGNGRRFSCLRKIMKEGGDGEGVWCKWVVGAEFFD